MSENKRSEGKLVTFEGTALSNISAGRMVAIDTGTNNIMTCTRETAGLTGSALAGARFIGVLDEDVSAGDSPISVWTEGVFRFRIASGSTLTGSAIIGKPVWTINSGSGDEVDATAVTGDMPIGVIVGGWDGVAEVSGDYVDVRLMPRMQWGPYGVQTATAANYFNVVWPPLV